MVSLYQHHDDSYSYKTTIGITSGSEEILLGIVGAYRVEVP